MDAAELKSKVSALQSATAEPEIAAILKALKSSAPITEKLLRETKAGLAVGKLRTHTSTEISDLAKELVKKWKTEVEKAKGPSSKNSPTPPASTASGNNTAVKKEPGQIKPAPIATAAKESPGANPTVASPTTPGGSGTRTAKSDGVVFDTTKDRTRDTCTQLVYDALASDSSAPSDLIFKRSVAIEYKVYQLHGGKIQGEYRNKMRSLYSNLKDKSNPNLRESVVSGDLSIETLCTMSSKDMASEERKAADSKLRDEALFHSLAAGEAEAETDAFQCGKCKQRKTRYRQAQTRSADEPMTTFVTCTNCGHRWKFS